MFPDKNLPLLLNLAYTGFNRALRNPNGSRGDFEPIEDEAGNIETTFCNLFIQYVCGGLGYYKFTGMTANEIFDAMSNPSNHWVSVNDEVAQAHANNGVLVLAAQKNAQGHGHVCLILPGILEKSASFGHRVPKCANVGKEVFFGRRVSFAFSEPPTYFAMGQMI